MFKAAGPKRTLPRLCCAVTDAAAARLTRVSIRRLIKEARPALALARRETAPEADSPPTAEALVGPPGPTLLIGCDKWGQHSNSTSTWGTNRHRHRPIGAPRRPSQVRRACPSSFLATNGPCRPRTCTCTHLPIPGLGFDRRTSPAQVTSKNRTFSSRRGPKLVPGAGRAGGQAVSQCAVRRIEAPRQGERTKIGVGEEELGGLGGEDARLHRDLMGDGRRSQQHVRDQQPVWLFARARKPQAVGGWASGQMPLNLYVHAMT